MIKNNIKDTTDKGQCVDHCPFHYYSITHPQSFVKYCFKDCPLDYDEDEDLDYGEDKEYGTCFLCSTIPNCDDCERKTGEFPTCKKCKQGYLPDENHETCWNKATIDAA